MIFQGEMETTGFAQDVIHIYSGQEFTYVMPCPETLCEGEF